MIRPLTLSQRCQIHANKMDDVGWYVTANVLAAAGEVISDLGEAIMLPTELKSARKRLGLSQAGLAAALRMGKHGGRTVRRWELGEVEVPGPVSVAVELMLEKAQTSPQPARSGSNRSER